MFETLATGLDHPEGAAWGPGGALYAGGEAGQVYRIGPDGAVAEIAGTGGFLFGIALDGAGNVYGCDMGRGEIVRITPDGAVSTYSSGTADHPLRVPNFAAFDDDGVLYVTDSGDWGEDNGALFRIEPGGTTSVWSTAVPAFPNGCCLTAEGDALLVVESRARRVVRVPIDDGIPGEPEPVVDVTGTQPDGIALAADGTMFIGCYRPDLVWRVPPGGEPERWAEDADGVVLNQPANPVFFGTGLDRLLVTSLGGWNLVAADPGVAGLPLRYPTV